MPNNAHRTDHYTHTHAHARTTLIHTHTELVGSDGLDGTDPLDLLASLGNMGDIDMRKLVDEAFNVRRARTPPSAFLITESRHHACHPPSPIAPLPPTPPNHACFQPTVARDSEDDAGPRAAEAGLEG